MLQRKWLALWSEGGYYNLSLRPGLKVARMILVVLRG